MRELEETGNYVLLDQYGNPVARRSYAPVAELMGDQLRGVDYLVAAAGSGASGAGVTEPYRAVFPEMRLVGVDTFNSTLFGLPDGERILRGLGNSLMPANLRHELYDEVDWLSAPLAFAATRRLYRESGLFRGPTTGAAWWVARSIAMRQPDARVVMLSADSGMRYIDDVFCDEWLHEHGAFMASESMPEMPVAVNHPGAAEPPWSMFDWGRRPYAEVMTVGDIARRPA